MADEGFKDRISALVQEKGGQNAFARLTGLSQSGVARLVKGGEPTLSTLKLIANASGRSLSWVATGAEQHGRDYAAMGPVQPIEQDDMVLVPVLDVRASAGAGAIVESEAEKGVMALRRDIVRALGVSAPGHLRVLEAEGNSMEPTIRAGDLLLVDTVIDHVRGEGIYVFRWNGSVVVKRIRITRNDGVELVSDNGGHIEKVPQTELPELHAAGRVVRVIRAV